MATMTFDDKNLTAEDESIVIAVSSCDRIKLATYLMCNVRNIMKSSQVDAATALGILLERGVIQHVLH